MLISFRWVWRASLLAACLVGTNSRAQNDAASRRAAIEGMYPVMIGALQAKNFGHARHICDQAIMWEPQNPVHHYNLACIEAQAGGTRLPYAWGALELAIALGFNEAQHLQNDSDLEPLRSDPRFADLVRKVIFNVSAGAAVASIKIPPAPEESPTRNASHAVLPEGELPAPAAFKDDLPVGMFLMTRYWPSSQMLEKFVWYFAPDRAVYQNLEHGFSRADLADHAGPRGTANRTGRSFEIAWSDGRKSASELERDGPGFTWDMGIFTPVVAFENPTDVAGIYECTESVGTTASKVPVAQRLDLRVDGTFSWDGVSFASTGPEAARLVAKHNEVTTGTWRMNGFSLILAKSDGVAFRRIFFPHDDEKTVVKPDRMFFGGLMYKRRP